jgi:sulfane dehydrogenase subunit SoxC
MSADERISRRSVIAGAAAAAGGLFLEKLPLEGAQALEAQPGSAPGTGTTALSARSAFESPARTPVGVLSGASYSPLQDLTGTITPNDLMFERHHAGVPALDPRTHRLLVHGLVGRAMTFTVDDLRRLPSVSRVYFIECSGNGRAAYRDPRPDMTPQIVDGTTSNGEWTGVPLSVLFRGSASVTA